MPPEVLQNFKFTKPSDVWRYVRVLPTLGCVIPVSTDEIISFGVLIFELHNPGITPFESTPNEKLVSLLQSGMAQSHIEVASSWYWTDDL